MTFQFFAAALLFVTVMTNLTVEGIKKILNDSGKKYSSNSLAVIVAIVISLVMSIVYIVMMNVIIDAKVIIEIIGLAYMSFLVATLGYDKVMQMIRQIRDINHETE